MAEPAQTQSRRSEHSQWHPGGAVAAWLLPGLGHIIVGQTRRGMILMVTLLGLYLAGLFIGGIDVIDSRDDRLWFVGQCLMGPITPLIDRYHQHARASADPPDVAVNRVNELGTLYCTLAGLLNLPAIMDVAVRTGTTEPAGKPAGARPSTGSDQS